jgi:cell division protein FtsB
VVNDPKLVRGQFGAFNLPMLVYAGATIAAVVIGVDAMNTADDAQAANARLNSEVAQLEERVKELETPASP